MLNTNLIYIIFFICIHRLYREEQKLVHAESTNSVSEDMKTIIGLGKQFSNIQVQSSTNTLQSELVFEDQNHHDMYQGGDDLVEGLLQNTKTNYQHNNAWSNEMNLLMPDPLLCDKELDDQYRDDLFAPNNTNPTAITRQNCIQSQPYRDDFNDFFMNANSNTGLKLQEQRLDSIAPKLFDF